MTDQQATSATTAEPVATAAPAANPPVAAPATPVANPTPSATVLSDDAQSPAAAAPSDYPSDWRETYAGEDEKKLNVLKRYASPKAMMDALFEARQKISAGQAKAITAESTPEEIAEWRKANNIPETSDKYDLNLGDGYIIGEADKPFVDTFLEKMHNKNASPEIVKEVLKSYYEMQQDGASQFHQKQAELKQSAQAELRKEFGGEYDRNINLLKGYLQNQFGEQADVLMGAMDETGTPLMNQPNVIRRFLQLALDHDPVGASMPGLGMQGIETVDSEIQAIEKRIGTDRKGYFKDEKAQKRYGELLAMKERYSKKAG